MDKMAKKAASAAPVKREVKKKFVIPEEMVDLSKKFPGKGYRISGKVVDEEEVKEVEVTWGNFVEAQAAEGGQVRSQTVSSQLLHAGSAG